MSFLSIKWLYHEFGVSSVYTTGRDAWLIILARTCRMFAYGTNSLILALFFSELRFTDYQIGLFMTLTMVGDVFLSVLLTQIADRLGRRRVLLVGSLLMVSSGLIFALFDNFWILLFGAVVGVISATGGDFGPFRAIEESMLSQLTTAETRSDVLSWYVTTSTLGSSIGMESSGRIIDAMLANWTLLEAYHAIFWIYVVMGVLNMAFMLSLSKKCEADVPPPQEMTEESENLLNDGEPKEPLDETESKKKVEPAPKKSSWSISGMFTEISKETRSVMYKLWFLLMVDSMADGMVPYSLTSYYMDGKFHLAKSTLGDIYSISYILAGVSTVFAGPLARRLGLVNTMVFTHIPSSAAVLLFPWPNNVPMTVLLLFVRTGLNNMDQAPRSAFIAAAVRPAERTAVMGITSMVRTLAATAGPTITGVLAGNDRFWIAFVAAGALRLAYDFGLWALFVNMKLHKHEPAKDGTRVADARRSSDEEELQEVAKA
jgi:MFS family permease